MIRLKFSGWKTRVRHNPDVITAWLKRVRRESRQAFEKGIRDGPHSGRIYRRRGGRRHQASVNRAQAEFPANDTGGLLKSIKAKSDNDSVEISSNQPYSRFLRFGTGKMQRRRMSDNALEMGLEKVGKPRGWVSFYMKG